MQRLQIRSLALVSAVALGVVLSGPAVAQEKLTIWWVKGFYKSEDDALIEA
ncbi:MAG: multiple sugar transport system substrate-binding protein, partial [Alphaproteobacteria bacterium]|nr:multiple sugar transport system substrate-binding protein [Alphaproteobacteria bacterium]